MDTIQLNIQIFGIGCTTVQRSKENGKNSSHTLHDFLHSFLLKSAIFHAYKRSTWVCVWILPACAVNFKYLNNYLASIYPTNHLSLLQFCLVVSKHLSLEHTRKIPASAIEYRLNEPIISFQSPILTYLVNWPTMIVDFSPLASSTIAVACRWFCWKWTSNSNSTRVSFVIRD